MMQGGEHIRNRKMVPWLRNCWMGLVEAFEESGEGSQLTVYWLLTILEADSAPSLDSSSQIHQFLWFSFPESRVFPPWLILFNNKRNTSLLLRKSGFYYQILIILKFMSLGTPGQKVRSAHVCWLHTNSKENFIHVIPVLTSVLMRGAVDLDLENLSLNLVSLSRLWQAVFLICLLF